MNLHKLKEAEAHFLARYPEGFDDPAMAAVKKRHNIDSLASFAREQLARPRFNQPATLCEAVSAIVTRSSMVSRFEKPRFKDFIKSLNEPEKEAFASAFEKRLYGRSKARGFEELQGMLAPFQLARWSVISVVPFYHAPEREAFVKPTTAKGILDYLEVDDLQYKPTPSWDFYRRYRQLLADIKAEVSPTLSPNYAALSGFLMTAI